MLDIYYTRPETIDRTRALWIAPAIEQYVHWLTEHRYTARSVLHRVPVFVRFGEFAKQRGACKLAQLPDHVEPFVKAWVRERGRGRSAARRHKLAQEVRNPVQQMLRLAVTGYVGRSRPHKPNNPFESQAPRFLELLTDEKGLRPRTLLHYRFHLRQFAAYLDRIGMDDLGALSPVVLGSFVA